MYFYETTEDILSRNVNKTCSLIRLNGYNYTHDIKFIIILFRKFTLNEKTIIHNKIGRYLLNIYHVILKAIVYLVRHVNILQDLTRILQM